MQSRRQAIIWINAGPIQWRIYAVLGGDGLMFTSGCHGLSWLSWLVMVVMVVMFFAKWLSWLVMVVMLFLSDNLILFEYSSASGMTSRAVYPIEFAHGFVVLCYAVAIYRQTSNIRRIEFQSLDVPRLVLQLSLPNPLKPGSKSRMKMQLHLSNPWQWRHNGQDGVSNLQPHDCLLNRLFKRRSKKASKLRATDLCAPGEFTGDRWFPRTKGQ